MKVLITFSAALALLFAAPARAADDESAKGAAHEALEAQAEAPKAPPKLPDEASVRANFVQQNIAHGENSEAKSHGENSEAKSHGENSEAKSHGENGEAKRAQHSESVEGVDSEAARHAATDSDSDAANKSAQGAAASAAKSANSDGHDAAGQARATEKRGGNPPGSGPGGHGHQPNPNPNPGHGH